MRSRLPLKGQNSKTNNGASRAPPARRGVPRLRGPTDHAAMAGPGLSLRGWQRDDWSCPVLYPSR